MRRSPLAPTSSQTTPDAARPTFWAKLVHRWFVEYNPLYILSAALVLGGCFLLSRDLARGSPLAATLTIGLLAELYAVCLIAGAALLTRIGPRRPAVMLALLALLYQWDLTLHTETCAYLGAAGAWAAAAWLALFVAKTHALGWALRVRFARHAMSAAVLAAFGLALGPRVFSAVGARGGGALIAAWLFALGALHRGPGAIVSLVELDAWGTVVLRRATRAAWLVSGALVAIHVWFWADSHALALEAVLLMAPLLVARRARSEPLAWALALATVTVAGATTPGAFFVTALLAGAALLARVFAPVSRPDPRAPSAPRTAVPGGPYREADPHRPGDAPPIPRVSTEEAGARAPSPPERARAVAGAIFAVYLGLWTANWSGGAWPAHVFALDLALTTAVLAVAWRLRARAPIAPLAATYGHLLVERGLLSAPQSAAAWGTIAVALGFALLGSSLAITYAIRRWSGAALDAARARAAEASGAEADE